MCEVAVYLLKGSERVEVMREAARVIASGNDVICLNPLGDRTTVSGAHIVEADLLKNEVVIKAF